MQKSMTDSFAVTSILLCYSLADALGALAIVCQMMDSPATIPWGSYLRLTIALSIQSLGLAWMGTRHPDRVDITYEIS